MLSRTVPASSCAGASAPARNTSGIGLGDHPLRALRSSGGARMGRARWCLLATCLDGAGPVLGLAGAYTEEPMHGRLKTAAGASFEAHAPLSAVDAGIDHGSDDGH